MKIWDNIFSGLLRSWYARSNFELKVRTCERQPRHLQIDPFEGLFCCKIKRRERRRVKPCFLVRAICEHRAKELSSGQAKLVKRKSVEPFNASRSRQPRRSRISTFGFFFTAECHWWEKYCSFRHLKQRLNNYFSLCYCLNFVGMLVILIYLQLIWCVFLLEYLLSPLVNECVSSFQTL